MVNRFVKSPVVHFLGIGTHSINCKWVCIKSHSISLTYMFSSLELHCRGLSTPTGVILYGALMLILVRFVRSPWNPTIPAPKQSNPCLQSLWQPHLCVRELLMRRFHHLQSYVGALECRRRSSSFFQLEDRSSHPVRDRSDAVWHFFVSCWFTAAAAAARSTKTSPPSPIPASKYSTTATSLNLSNNLLNFPLLLFQL